VPSTTHGIDPDVRLGSLWQKRTLPPLVIARRRSRRARLRGRRGWRATTSLVTAQPIDILLVEDDELDVINVERATQGASEVRSLTVASDGSEALDKLRSGSLGLERLLVLLDLRMPRMSGLELLAHLRADPRLCKLPVIILTTSAHEDDRSEAFRLGAAGYFVKPGATAPFRDLIATLRHYWSHSELASP
jgi:CheY-like chemotaxis protein